MRYFFIFILCVLAFSCQEKYKNTPEKYRHLDTNQVNILRIGEEFVLYNSRTDGLEYDNSLYFDIDTNFVKLIETQVEESSSDCAGCTTYYTQIYKTLKKGKTTIKVFKYTRADLSEKAQEIVDSLVLTLPQEILNDSLLALKNQESLFKKIQDSLFNQYLSKPVVELSIEIN